MRLDDLLTTLFPQGHRLTRTGAVAIGIATLMDGSAATVLAIADAAPLGVEEALALAEAVLAVIAREPQPIILLIDSASQRMSRRDELLGLNDYLAHLAKVLLLARHAGHRTVALLYGGSAAGAFIATALACDALVALAGSSPAVMDLPSMARVTKMPVARLEALAHDTPVFAPGVDNMVRIGAIDAVWRNDDVLDHLLATLANEPNRLDGRDLAGAARGGRSAAARIAATVIREVIDDG